MPQRVNISILLKNSCRNPESIARVQEIASRLHIEPSTSGKVSVCGKMPVDRFETLFGVKAIPLEKMEPNEKDFGSGAGFYSEEPLNIPEELKEYVESIAIEPPSTLFG